MTTFTQIASSPRAHLRSHLSAYLVGVGATAALTAGALVVFLSLATFVAFNGLPFGQPSDGVGAAYLDPITTGAPTAAGAALGAAPGAVAKEPVRGSGGSSAHPRSATAAADGSGGSRPGGGDTTGKGASGGATDTGTSGPPGNITSPPIDVPSLPSTSGPVSSAVQVVDNAGGTNLSGATGGVTRAVDGAAAGRVGGAVGRQGLGGQAGAAVSGVTGGALGG